MEQGGYAASGVKHCVRPVDMSGKTQIESYSTLYACLAKPKSDHIVLCMHVHASRGTKSENCACGLHLLAPVKPLC